MFMSNSRLVYPLVSICGHLVKKQWYRTIYLQYFYLCPYLPAYLFIFICTHTHAYIDGQIDKCICEHRYCGKFRGPSSNITILRVVRSVQITMNETLKKQYPFSPMYALRNMAARHRARNLSSTFPRSATVPLRQPQTISITILVAVWIRLLIAPFANLLLTSVGQLWFPADSLARDRELKTDPYAMLCENAPRCRFVVRNAEGTGCCSWWSGCTAERSLYDWEPNSVLWY